MGPPLRRRKLHISRFRLTAKARSFRCSSSPHRTRGYRRWASAGTPSWLPPRGKVRRVQEAVPHKETGAISPPVSLRSTAPSSEGAKGKSLPLTREVAFAKQMTEGETGRPHGAAPTNPNGRGGWTKTPHPSRPDGRATFPPVGGRQIAAEGGGPYRSSQGRAGRTHRCAPTVRQGPHCGFSARGPRRTPPQKRSPSDEGGGICEANDGGRDRAATWGRPYES